jgi:hypothetical protein
MRQYYNIVLAAAVTAVLALLFFNIFSDRYKEREYNSSFEWPALGMITSKAIFYFFSIVNFVQIFLL